VACLLLCTAAFAAAAKGFESAAPPFVACASLNATLPCDALWNLSAASACGRAQVTSLAALDGSPGECETHLSAIGGGWLPTGAPWLAAPNASAQMCPLPLAPGAAAAAVARCAAAICLGCSCVDRGLSAWLADDQWLGSFCDAFWHHFGLGWALRAASFVVIIIVNLVLRGVLPGLTRFERLHTQSSTQLSLAIKTLLSLFCNSFVVSLIIDSRSVSLGTSAPLSVSGPAFDYTPRWYATAGASLAITCFTQALQPSWMHWLTAWLWRSARDRRASRAHTQADMNDALAPPQWQLGTRLSGTFTCIWLSQALCGGMPYVALLQPLCLALCIAVDRWYLFRVAAKPPQFGVDVVLSISRLLLWGVCLHFGLTAWQFASPFLPAYDSTAPAPSQSSDEAGLRLGRWQSLLQGVPFLAIATWLLLLQPAGGAQLWGGGRRHEARRRMQSFAAAPAPGGWAKPSAAGSAGPGQPPCFPEDSFASATARLGGWTGPLTYMPAELPRYEERLAALHSLRPESPLARTSMVPLLQLKAPPPSGQLVLGMAGVPRSPFTYTLE
jgi:hypothetical protein